MQVPICISVIGLPCLDANTVWAGHQPTGLDVGQALDPDGKQNLKSFHPLRNKDVQAKMCKVTKSNFLPNVSDTMSCQKLYVL